MKGTYCILLLILSNTFMTLAWYGHLFFKTKGILINVGLLDAVFISWGLALFEYIFQVPANKIGFEGNNGPFSLFELKIIQEAITLIIFSLFAVFIFKTDKLAWNYIVGFILILLAVFFIFKKW